MLRLFPLSLQIPLFYCIKSQRPRQRQIFLTTISLRLWASPDKTLDFQTSPHPPPTCHPPQGTESLLGTPKMPTPFALRKRYIRPGERFDDDEECIPLCPSSDTVQTWAPPSFSGNKDLKLYSTKKTCKEIIHHMFHAPCASCGETHRRSFLPKSESSRCKGTFGRVWVCKHVLLSFAEAQNIRTSFKAGKRFTIEDFCDQKSCSRKFYFREGGLWYGLQLYQYYSVVKMPDTSLGLPRVPRLDQKHGDIAICPHTCMADVLGQWTREHGEFFHSELAPVWCKVKDCYTTAYFYIREENNWLGCSVRRQLGRLKDVRDVKWTSQVCAGELEIR
jgi:hypothetical protein